MSSDVGRCARACVCGCVHRCNRAADLINEVLNGYYDMDMTDAFSRIYVWLRYSATRKLTWQRNYNTQPRILSAAQDRLTNAIANAHRRTTGGWGPWRSAVTQTHVHTHTCACTDLAQKRHAFLSQAAYTRSQIEQHTAVN